MQPSAIFRNQWFGKATFAICAIVIAPEDPLYTAIWALVGLGIGHQIDEWACNDQLTLRQSLDARRLLRQAKAHNPWLIYTFAGLGHLGKVAGPVRPEHINHARELMRQLRFDAEERERAQGWFKAGKIPGCPFPELAQICRNWGHPEFETFTLTSLRHSITLAQDEKGQRVCELACTGLLLLLGVSASKARTPGSSDGTTDGNAQGTPINATQMSPADARQLLGVSKDDDPDTVTQAYRRLVARLHPDRLPSHASDEQRGIAEQRMAEVNVAREVLSSIDSGRS